MTPVFYIMMVSVLGSGEPPEPVMGTSLHSAMSYEFCSDMADELTKAAEPQGLVYFCIPMSEAQRAEQE